MTIFKFLEKPIVLKCFTDRLEVATLSPIKPASTYYPEWWKKLPKTYTPDKENLLNEQPTVKTCLGIINQYQNSAIIPLWSDLNIGIGAIDNSAQAYQYADEKSSITEHPSEQRGTFLPDDQFQHLKLIVPWRILCDDPVKFMIIEPTWNFDQSYLMKVLPGTLDFKYQHSSHINMMFTRTNEDRKFHLPFNTPVGHIVPLSERTLKIEVEFDPVMFNLLQSKSYDNVHFFNKYLNKRRIIEQNEASKSKCPFGFGKK